MKYGELQRSIPYEEVNEIYEKQKQVIRNNDGVGGDDKEH